MGWTYTGKDALARAANALYRARALPCKLGPIALMSDPQRQPDICAAALKLPEDCTLIYRHFGAANRAEIAAKLRQIAFARNLQLLIGKDIDLAIGCGADGVHLPEADLQQASALRRRFPDWLITGAAHSGKALGIAAKSGLDAAILSPVFSSQSASAGTPLGVPQFSKLVKAASLPVFALGGINAGTAPKLIGSGAAGIAGVSGFAHA